MPKAAWPNGKYDAITDVPGIKVGHWTDRRGGTGCTAILCETAVAAAVDVRGGAPGTRETEVLAPANAVRTCHAITFCGGSAFGLAAATGVMRHLAEREVGFPTTARPVPIVPAAVIFDLGFGSPLAFPDDDAGYLAAKRARSGRVEQGTVGAGAGATVAKLLGMERAMKGGLGTASVAGPRGLIAGALVVCNASGSIFEPSTARLIAGPRDDNGRLVPVEEALERRTAEMDAMMENTTLVCVAINAKVEHRVLLRLAYQAHDGLARAILPVHAFSDGDTAFALSMGAIESSADDATVLGAMVVRAVERAIVNGVRAAKGTLATPSISDGRVLPNTTTPAR